jgi:hypothetical protein
MGAWGEGALQNDAALDWLIGLGSKGVEALRKTLALAADTAADDYLDVDDGSAALVAAEMVAAARHSIRDNLGKRVAAWLDAHAETVTADDEALAKRAVQRVLAKNSELASLWGGSAEWNANAQALLQRLRGDASS